jgi:hypothetical protein
MCVVTASVICAGCRTRQTLLVAVNSIAPLLCLINTPTANLFEVCIYVAFRSNRSEEAIRKQVLKDLQDYSIDVRQ